MEPTIRDSDAAGGSTHCASSAGADRVIVIGGGPAGLAAAIAARLAGFRAVVVERRRPPIDKACGEGIMPDGVESLARLGVRLPAGAVFQFGGIRYVESGTVATGCFHGVPGIGVRRTVLHDALRQRAEDLGVDLLWGRAVRRITADGVRLDDGAGDDEVACPNGVLGGGFIVAADGQGSPLRRALGLDLPPRHRRFGLRRHYAVGPWSDFVEVHWANGLEAYVTPVGTRHVCVAMLAGDPALRFDEALSRFPEVARRLAGARALGEMRGGPSVFRRARAVVRGNVALLGDASVSLDAISGAGVTLALHQALALGRALKAGDLSIYEREHRSLMRPPWMMTRLMLSIHDRARLRRPVLGLLAAAPAMFSLLLALHTRALARRRAPDAAPLTVAGPLSGTGSVAGPGPIALARE